MARFNVGQEVEISPRADIALMKRYNSPLTALGKRGLILASAWQDSYKEPCYKIMILGIATHWWYLESMLTIHKNLNELVS